MTYKLSVYNEELVGIIHLPTNSYIPLDPNNTDYQEYLEWVEEGNTPEPAD
jgi:hypothetical protein